MSNQTYPIGVIITEEFDKLYELVTAYSYFIDDIGKSNFEAQVLELMDEYFLLAIYNRISTFCDPRISFLEYDDKNYEKEIKKLNFSISKDNKEVFFGKINWLYIDEKYYWKKEAKYLAVTFKVLNSNETDYWLNLDFKKDGYSISASFDTNL